MEDRWSHRKKIHLGGKQVRKTPHLLGKGELKKKERRKKGDKLRRRLAT